MRRVRVKLEGRRDDSYTIRIETGLLKKIPGLLPPAAAYAVVSDAAVAGLYGSQLVDSIEKKGHKCHLVTFPAGERSKNRRTKEKIEDALFTGFFGRDGCIIALGGGVTGDMAGFVAATYMRGVPYVQVPTTLLAMVDSSVGGKTAVDVPAGKNLVGAFYQPAAVYIDPTLLASLPPRQVRAGMAEVVKHAVVADGEFFLTLDRKARPLMESDAEVLEPVLAKNCAIKAAVVSRDEKEGNYRQVLNYGHTVAHAIEKVSRFKVLHGEAVAMGMAVEAAISNTMGIFPDDDLARQNDLLDRLGLKVKLPGGAMPERIMDAMRTDKKARASKIRMALPEAIGKMHSSASGEWSIAPSEKTIRAALEKLAQ